MSSCPYVPPHPLNIDFPHMILRYRAVEQRKNKQYDLIEDKENEKFYWPHSEEVHKTEEGVSTQLSFKSASSVNYSYLYLIWVD